MRLPRLLLTLGSAFALVLVFAQSALADPRDFYLNNNSAVDQGGAQNLVQRSDQWPFLAHGIPAVFLTTGLHPDYHTPQDDTDRIDFAKLERVARLEVARREVEECGAVPHGGLWTAERLHDGRRRAGALLPALQLDAGDPVIVGHR